MRGMRGTPTLCSQVPCTFYSRWIHFQASNAPWIGGSQPHSWDVCRELLCLNNTTECPILMFWVVFLSFSAYLKGFLMVQMFIFMVLALWFQILKKKNAATCLYVKSQRSNKFLWNTVTLHVFFSILFCSLSKKCCAWFTRALWNFAGNTTAVIWIIHYIINNN